MNIVNNILYIHGKSGNTWSTYENYLKEECEKKSINVTFIDFPKEDKCTYIEWENVMKNYLKSNTINEHTVIVSRCLGSRFIVKYIAENNIKLKGLVCIATSFGNKFLVERKNIEKIWPSFPVTEESIAKARENIEKRIFIFGDQDYLFSKEDLEKSAELINAEKFFIPGLNHCGNTSGKKEFPELIEAIKRINLEK